jgi:DNA-binding LytR/AlgR family response regulator
MSISTYIVDDEPHAIDRMRKYILQTPGLTLQGFSNDPLKALAEMTATPPALAFLDIDMPVLSGLELAGLIGAGSQVVLTTAYREFGPEAFEKNILDYLLKPFSYERFLNSIQKFKKTVNNTSSASLRPQAIFVTTGARGSQTRVLIDDIIYIEGAQNYLWLHLTTEKLMTYLPLHELLEQLPADRFYRIHKSFAINLEKIKSIEPGHVRLSNQALLSVGRTYAGQLGGLFRAQSAKKRR